MRQKAKLIKIACSLITLLFVIYGLSYFVRLGQYKRAIAEMTFTPIDLSQIQDGSYYGECDVDFIAAKVKVTVSEHTITSIDLLEHHNQKGLPAESLIPTMVQEQTTDVDAVTGATNSSKVIRKSIENALLSH